jgi:hypothetical protein
MWRLSASSQMAISIAGPLAELLNVSLFLSLSYLGHMLDSSPGFQYSETTIAVSNEYNPTHLPSDVKARNLCSKRTRGENTTCQKVSPFSSQNLDRPE